MLPSLRDAFIAELQTLNAQLVDERRQLVEMREDTPSAIAEKARAVAEDRFEMLETLIRKIAEARDGVAAAETEAAAHAVAYVRMLAAARAAKLADQKGRPIYEN